MLPESTPPSQNIPPPFSTNAHVRSRIYSSLPEYTPPPFLTTIILCEPRRICPSLPEYTPLFNNYNIMRPSQNIPLPSRIYPLFNNSMRCSQNLPLLPRIYLPLFNKCTCALQDLPLPPRIYLYCDYVKCRPIRLPESTPPSQTIPSFSTTICDPPRVYPSLP